MNQKEAYPALDIFRLVAVVMVVAIHTAPLGGVWETGDFLLTRVLCRIAVPFFLMTTGYFVLPRFFSGDVPALKNAARKHLILYLVAIAIYLPFLFRNGYFSSSMLLFSLPKDFFFDGMFYHLWYLPAVFVGLYLLYGLYRITHKNLSLLLVLTLLLYAMGLLGDSYYRLSQQIPGVDRFYQSLFYVVDYTRNGVFFAPIFLLLGGILGKTKRRFSKNRYLLLFLLSFSLMICEALILHRAGYQRHDSMYLLLLPCMVFLFCYLASFRGRGYPQLRAVSMAVYIIHPLMIVAVRGMAKLLSLESLLIQNNPVHFLAVTLLSFLCGWLYTWIRQRRGQRRKT